MLYPLKFEYIIKEKVWGGEKLTGILHKKTSTKFAGESWEISGVKDNLSIVSNGVLKGKTILELIKEYKQIFLGDSIYKRFGESFPLLIKFIDADDDLSVQVHPDDEAAQRKHNENGKTEIWYVIDADVDAELILGVNRNLTKEEYIESVEKGTLRKVINSIKVKKGDVAYIPAGRIHAIKKGVFLAEIQQSSDLTYRIYDWDRKGLDGKFRELHTELAAEVVDLEKKTGLLIDYSLDTNKFNKLIANRFFTVNISEIDKPLKKDYSEIDSFIILMNVFGDYSLKYSGEILNVKVGETILLPAELDKIEIIPKTETKLLEIYI